MAASAEGKRKRKAAEVAPAPPQRDDDSKTNTTTTVFEMADSTGETNARDDSGASREVPMWTPSEVPLVVVDPSRKDKKTQLATLTGGESGDGVDSRSGVGLRCVDDVDKSGFQMVKAGRMRHGAS